MTDQFVGGQRVTHPGPEEMLRDALVRIGRLERAAGTGWRFNVDNEGGFGYLQFNDCFDLDTFPDPLTVGGMWGAAFEDASGCGFLIGSTSVLLLKTKGGPLNVLSDPGDITVFANGGSVDITDTAGLNVNSAGIALNLPLAPGAAGTLWNDSGTVKVA